MSYFIPVLLENTSWYVSTNFIINRYNIWYHFVTLITPPFVLIGYCSYDTHLWYTTPCTCTHYYPWLFFRDLNISYVLRYFLFYIYYLFLLCTWREFFNDCDKSCERVGNCQVRSKKIVKWGGFPGINVCELWMCDPIKRTIHGTVPLTGTAMEKNTNNFTVIIDSIVWAFWCLIRRHVGRC